MSFFKQEQLARQEQLLHSLVTNLLPVKPGEENYDTAMDFCAGNINPKYHSFKEPNPREVRELYAGLSDRMQQHSQLSKASRLRQLYSQLISLKLQGTTDDMDASILLLLFNLAEKPLQQGKLLEQPAAPPQHASGAKARGLSDSSSADDDEEPCSDSWDSGSELSEWGDDDDDAKEQKASGSKGAAKGVAQAFGALALDAAALPHTAASARAKETETTAAATGGTAAAQTTEQLEPNHAPITPQALPPRRAPRSITRPSAHAAGRLHMPTFPPMTNNSPQQLPPPITSQQHAIPDHSDLTPSLARSQLWALPFMAPHPHKCLSDRYITHQVLNLLLNDSSTCFQRTPTPKTSTPSSLTPPEAYSTPAPSYEPLPGLHVPYLSPGMLHSLMYEFAEAGSHVAWLQAVIAASTAATHTKKTIGVPGITDRLHITPCCQALLQAAASQLRVISQPLLELQQANKDGRAGSNSSSSSTHLPHSFDSSSNSSSSSVNASPSLLQLRQLCSVPMRRLSTLREAVHMALHAQAAAERTADNAHTAAERAAGKAGSAVSDSRRSSIAGSVYSAAGSVQNMGTTNTAAVAGSGGMSRVGSVQGMGTAANGAQGANAHAHANAHANATGAQDSAGGNEAPQASSLLLDALHAMLEKNALETGPLGQVVQQQLLHLFLCSLTPLLDGLSTWLYDNWEDHFPDDFFVAPGQQLPETHHLFWSGAFRLMLRHNADGKTSLGQVVAEQVDVTQIACPRFLQPVVCGIFSAGKSLRLLKNSEQGGLGGKTPAGPAALPGMSPIMMPLVPPPLRFNLQSNSATAGVVKARAPLRQQFLGRLHSFLAGHELDPAAELAAVVKASFPSSYAAGASSSAADLGAGGSVSASATAAFPSPSAAAEAEKSGQQGHEGSSNTIGFSSRMAAAGLSHSVLQKVDRGVQGIGHAHTGVGTSVVMPGQTEHERRREGEGVQLGGGQRVESLSHSAEGGRDLEEQCRSVAAAMSQGNLSLAWEMGGMQNQSQDSIRSDLAQRLKGCLMPSSQSTQAAWIRPKDQMHVQLGWLLEGPCLDLPPVELVLEQCLLGILRQRVDDIGQCLLSCLLSDWGLLAELSSLKNLFLMASPSAQAWADRTLSGMLFKGRPLENHHEYELDVALQEVIAEADQDEALPSIDAVSVALDKERVAEMHAKAAAAKASEPGSTTFQAQPARSAHCALHSVLELEGLQFRYQPSWLMSMIGGGNAISSYNNAFVFLMQIRAARMALEDARVQSWKSWKHQSLLPSEDDSATTGVHCPKVASRPSLSAKEEDLVMQEMCHFVSNLDQFVVDRLLCGAWMQLEQDLNQARTLDDVVRHHRAFLATLDRQAGRGTHGETAGAWKHLVFGINKVLDQVLLFCSALRALASYQKKTSNVQDGGVAGFQDSLYMASNEFRRLHRYLLKFLGNKTHKIGGEPDLENLIMRINFNHYYQL